MIILQHAIEVEAPTEAVFAWIIRHLSDSASYQAWHPDHVDICWLKGEPFTEGSILRADEYLHGVLHRLKFRIVAIVPNRKIAYRPLFPFSLLAPANSFSIEPLGTKRCTFTAQGHLRLPLWLVDRFFPNQQIKIAATKQHLKEEGQHLKKQVEAEQRHERGKAQ